VGSGNIPRKNQKRRVIKKRGGKKSMEDTQPKYMSPKKGDSLPGPKSSIRHVLNKKETKMSGRKGTRSAAGSQGGEEAFLLFFWIRKRLLESVVNERNN